MVDCSDEDRLEEARIELHEHLSDANMKGEYFLSDLGQLTCSCKHFLPYLRKWQQFSDKNLLVIISKRDLPNALSDEMLVDRLNLNVIKGREVSYRNKK